MHTPGILGLAFLAGDTYPSNPLQEYMDCIFLLFVHDTGRYRESLIYNLDRFRLERVSSRFSRQYEERYIDPNQIQLNGLLPAIYFMRTAGDRKITPYTPDTWTEEEKKDKYLFVSEQGTMEAKLEGRVETYLTFLEPEQPGD